MLKCVCVLIPASAKRAPTRTAARNTPSSKPSAGPKRPRARLPSSSGDEEEEKGVKEDEEQGCSKAPRKRARRLKSDTEESQVRSDLKEEMILFTYSSCFKKSWYSTPGAERVNSGSLEDWTHNLLNLLSSSEPELLRCSGWIKI